MPFSVVSESGWIHVELNGAVIIRDAQDLAQRLTEALGEGVPVRVNTANLEDIDTCILQLLCSLRKTVPALSFADPSAAFSAAVDRCGLRRELLGSGEGS